MDSESFLTVDSIDTYYGDSHILQDVSMRVDEGEFIALIGWNGAGKSTTLKSIMGLAPPRNGEIRFRDRSIQGMQPHEVARLGIGYIPDDRAVFPDLTVEENIRTGTFKSVSRNTPDYMFDQFPVLEERLSQRAGTLSGGQQQMLVMARALAGNPDLLLIDEPLEGLQPSIVDEMCETLREINERGISFVMVEQNALLALDMSDRAYIMRSGRIINEGDADEIKVSDEVEEEFSSFA